jgi:hypothetical protein
MGTSVGMAPGARASPAPCRSPRRSSGTTTRAAAEVGGGGQGEASGGEASTSESSSASAKQQQREQEQRRKSGRTIAQSFLAGGGLGKMVLSDDEQAQLVGPYKQNPVDDTHSLKCFQYD